MNMNNNSNPTAKPSNGFVRFTLARLQYLSIDGNFRKGTAPGEWYWMGRGYRKIGITLHLATILPAGLLVILQVKHAPSQHTLFDLTTDACCPQFVPIVRYKALLFHRMNGYVVIFLLLVSNAGAIMVARRSYGGGFELQTGIGLLVIVTTGAAGMAYINIKRLQIEEHRAWMLRTWFYAGSIITLRIIMIISTVIVSQIGGFYRAMSCDEIAWIYADKNRPGLRDEYPQCFVPNGTTNGYVAVEAKFGAGANPAQIGTSLHTPFGAAAWLALFLHAVGVEIYLRLTPRESERLRKISYQKQLEAGFKHPGSAGIKSDRLGDADAWEPPQEGKERTVN
ncbi:MAG: hypothetical protein L6R35_004344 [Caloplaca aegaea]|nr:MAG: hypothetical protein L6R35_004344 [Caloplaca aegaea]